jgi:alkylation response protein AidB-like acyl-CoA dehydrogenase
MNTAERTLLAETVRDAVANATSADDALAGLGWLEMLAAEPDAALEIVFTALGATHQSATALDDVLVAALGREPRSDRAAILPAFGSWDPPVAQGLATARVTTATEIVVAGAVVPIANVTVTKLHGIDPDAGWCTVTVNGPATTSDQWAAAVALGRRAVAYEIAGASRAMLDLAREHALERVQFGRPVARFQAVRHRLAEALVAIESLDACLDAAADAPGPETAALAKAAAGRTARTVAGHCQQVLAGIGFTTDHPFHRYLKRTMLLDGVFGTADDIVTALGHTLLATRRVPTLIEL